MIRLRGTSDHFTFPDRFDLDTPEEDDSTPMLALSAEKEHLTTVTEFNKSPSGWLTEAASKPVTITRPKATDITLISRDRWQDASISQSWLALFSAIVRYAAETFMGVSGPTCPADFSWLTLFEKEDLREFVDELSTALQGVALGLRPWSDVNTVVEEWRRSAIVLNDQELRRRFKDTLKDIRS